eukprot:16619-Heterococcus_DN1.PRE.8
MRECKLYTLSDALNTFILQFTTVELYHARATYVPHSWSDWDIGSKEQRDAYVQGYNEMRDATGTRKLLLSDTDTNIVDSVESGSLHIPTRHERTVNRKIIPKTHIGIIIPYACTMYSLHTSITSEMRIQLPMLLRAGCNCVVNYGCLYV